MLELVHETSPSESTRLTGSRTDDNTDLPIWLDASRAAASLCVLVGHTFLIIPVIRGFPSWPQQLGVGVFFVLSGFLIAQTLRRRLSDPRATFLSFAIDRWARIYSGFLPAILLVAVLDQWSIVHFAGTNLKTVDRHSLPIFLANLVMLQAPPNVAPFGSAGPFWTVAIEFWIYMFVGLFVFSVRDGLTVSRFVLLCLFGLIPMQAINDSLHVFIPWLLGAAIETLTFHNSLRKIDSSTVAGIAIVGAGGFVLCVVGGWGVYNVPAYCAVAVVFAATVELSRRSDILTRMPALGSFILWWASWSYSLYLIHHTILMFTATAINSNTSRLCVGIASSIAGAVAFSMVTERHHRKLGALIKRRILGQALLPDRNKSNLASGRS
jgi:peptidoglycan/LPS O-acetylase OafA/YrhL